MPETEGCEVSTSAIPPQVWQLDAASLSDANKALRILPRELRPYRRGLRMVGRAVTVAAYADLMPVLAGLQQSGPGDVLAVDAGTTEHAVLGELFPTEAATAWHGRHRRLRSVPRHGATARPVVRRSTALGQFRAPSEQRKISIDRTSGTARGRRGPPWRDSDRRRRWHRRAQRFRTDAALDAAEAIQQREAAIRAAILDGSSLFEQLNFTEHVENLGAGRPTALAFQET